MQMRKNQIHYVSTKWKHSQVHVPTVFTDGDTACRSQYKRAYLGCVFAAETKTDQARKDESFVKVKFSPLQALEALRVVRG
jgi:predicted adenine nucleotide alpha hydrolase (AANH) superfamily ATPase